MKNHNKTISNGTLYACVLVLPGAQTDSGIDQDSLPARIQREIAGANTLWQQKTNGKTRGVQFKLSKFINFNKKIKGIDFNAENIVMTQRKVDQIGRLLLEIAKKFCENADVYIIYMNGDTIGPVQSSGSRVLAMTYIDYPIIIMSNGAKGNDFILAHELGHFMFINNRFGNTSDPDPLQEDPAHNANPDNLMFPTGKNWPTLPKLPNITADQIKKALDIRFFYD